MPPNPPPAATITKTEFNTLLAQYPSLITTISKSKGAKDGQKTLQELDEFRYGEALRMFSGEGAREMELGDVKTLVEWKLRHGTFRPNLLSLASSNPPILTKTNITSALTTYRTTGDIPSTLAILTKLKGIGPATASLLLTVHDPKNIIFFSDEAFYWLCCGGRKSSVKYNKKEYEALRLAAGALVERLGVSATDVEKVAYVVMKRERFGESFGESQGATSAKDSKSNTTAKDIKPKPTAKDTKPKTPNSSISATKRKENSTDESAKDDASIRRSKRLKS